MTDLRKAAEMALNTLERCEFGVVSDGRLKGAIQALRQALAQPEQEPVAWINKDGWFRKAEDADAAFRAYAFPLYAGPKKKEWVGLTDEEGAEIWGDAHDIDWNRLITPKEIVKRIEAKLKEKNGG